jgi:hypothetical protein
MSFYEETVWCVEPGRDASVPRADSKHRELKSLGQFLYQKNEFFYNTRMNSSSLQGGFDPSNFNIGQLAWDLNRHPRGSNQLHLNRNRLVLLGLHAAPLFFD